MSAGGKEQELKKLQVYHIYLYIYILVYILVYIYHIYTHTHITTSIFTHISIIHVVLDGGRIYSLAGKPQTGHTTARDAARARARDSERERSCGGAERRRRRGGGQAA